MILDVLDEGVTVSDRIVRLGLANVVRAFACIIDSFGHEDLLLVIGFATPAEPIARGMVSACKMNILLAAVIIGKVGDANKRIVCCTAR
jgi:hypothetical protein